MGDNKPIKHLNPGNELYHDGISPGETVKESLPKIGLAAPHFSLICLAHSMWLAINNVIVYIDYIENIEIVMRKIAPFHVSRFLGAYGNVEALEVVVHRFTSARTERMIQIAVSEQPIQCRA